MFLTIGNVLSEAGLSEVQTLIKALDWRDGAHTAGARARAVKRNEQADLSSEAGAKIIAIAQDALTSQPVFQSAARPRTFSKFLLSRTAKGGGYGAHIDNAIMGRGSGQMRSDLSFTLFLNSPEAYEGGALNIETPAGTQSIKQDAGDLVLYPSSLIHEVTPVTAGVRLVLVGWIQSHIRDIAQREILFDLDRVRVSLDPSKVSDTERLILDKTVSNLLRLWSVS